MQGSYRSTRIVKTPNLFFGRLWLCRYGICCMECCPLGDHSQWMTFSDA